MSKEIDEINNKIIKNQDEIIEILKEQKKDLTQMLLEISSQLKDRGGFEIITNAIDEKLSK